MQFFTLYTYLDLFSVDFLFFYIQQIPTPIFDYALTPLPKGEKNKKIGEKYVKERISKL